MKYCATTTCISSHSYDDNRDPNGWRVENGADVCEAGDIVTRQHGWEHVMKSWDYGFK